MELGTIQQQMDSFVRDRGWYKSASPKPQTPSHLAMSMAIEVGELLECFQWGPAEQLEAVAAEIADVVLYAAQLANVLNIDLAQATAEKLRLNEARFDPAEAAL